MSHHSETNPHFKPPQQSEAQRLSPPVSPDAPPLRRRDQQNQPPSSRGKRHQGERSKPQALGDGKAQKPRKQSDPREDQHPQPQDPRHGGRYSTPWFIPPHTDETHPVHDNSAHDPQPDGKYHSPWIRLPQPQDEDQGRLQKTRPRGQDEQPEHPDNAKITQPQRLQEQDHYPIHPHGPGHPPPHQQDHYRQSNDLRTPAPQRTRLITWIGAAICAIFWIVIFLGGLIVLIIYLVYRPRSPRFEVSSATLNAAYLDAGSLLNADISLLVNFTNPNKKVDVDFKHIILDLYYGNTLIATQYIESFSAARAVSTFANVHMVTSQVRLPLGESARLQDQNGRNGIILDIKGVFRVRSNLGSFLRYSYRLYGHCTIMVTAPPSGVLRATRCRTKR